MFNNNEISKMITRYNPYSSIRESQQKAIEDILLHFNPDVEEPVIVELPAATAFGKTVCLTIVQKILANEYEEDMVLGTTPLVELIRQYSNNPMYKDVPCLLGRSNYRCEVNKELSASDCLIRGKKGKYYGQCKNCEYKIKKKEFDNSPFGWTTFDRYLYDPSIKSRVTCLLIDESASIESKLRGFSDLELPITIDVKNLVESLKKYVIELEELHNQIEFEIENIMEQMDKEPGFITDYVKTVRKCEQVEKKMQNTKQAIYYVEHDIKFLITNEEKQVYNKKTKIFDKVPIRVFKLLTAHIPFAGMISGLKFVVLSSATPATKILTSKEYKIIDTIHPIPVERRPMVFRPVGSMSYASREETAKKMAPVILELHKDFESNTMVHCGSYIIAKMLYTSIMENLNCQNEEKFRLYNKSVEDVILQTNKNRNQCKKEFENGAKKIWLSVEFSEGIDLAGEKYKLNIIAKLPAEAWKSDYVQARNLYDTQNFGSNIWYNQTSANKMIQSYGRICRRPDDFGVTYCLDSAALGFWKRYKNNLFPSWFNQAVSIY